MTVMDLAIDTVELLAGQVTYQGACMDIVP